MNNLFRLIFFKKICSSNNIKKTEITIINNVNSTFYKDLIDKFFIS